MASIAMATGFVLILIGFWGALTQRHLLRMIVAFSVADTGVNLVIVAVGYLGGRTAPILDATVTPAQALQRIIDPLPQALVLTAIVIGFGLTVFAVTLLHRAQRATGSDDLDAFNRTDAL